MGSNESVSISQEDMETLQKDTGFTPKQIQRFYKRFQVLGKKNAQRNYLTREDFMENRKIALNPLGQRFIDVIIEDYGNDNRLYFPQFLHIFAHFQRGKSTNMNSIEKKLQFLFNIYDRNHDSKIDRDELTQILRMMVGGDSSEEQMSNIADHTIEELSTNNDLTITFEAFCNALSKIHVDEKLSIKIFS